MKRRKTLQEILEQNANLDLLTTKDALECCKQFLIAEPNRAMIFEKDGNSVSLVSKRSLLDSLVNRQPIKEQK